MKVLFISLGCDKNRVDSEVMVGILKERGYSLSKGDEGGYAPLLSSNEEGIKLVLEAITRASYTPGKDVYLALDIASSELYNSIVSSSISISHPIQQLSLQRSAIQENSS